MNIKTKIYIGIIFLFSEFLIVSVFSTYSAYTLSKHVKMMTADNVVSIQYAESMLYGLDEINEIATDSILNQKDAINTIMIQQRLDILEKDLRNEEGNITEAGEKEAVTMLRKNFNRYRESFSSFDRENDYLKFYYSVQRPLLNAVKSDLYKVSRVNMQSILRKNKQVSESVNKSYVWLSVIATVFFLVSFSFIFNFPRYITDPIKEFSDSIKEFGKHNDRSRLHYKQKDELGEIANAFNVMAEKSEDIVKGISKKSVKRNKNVNDVVVEKKKRGNKKIST